MELPVLSFLFYYFYITLDSRAGHFVRKGETLFPRLFLAGESLHFAACEVRT